MLTTFIYWAEYKHNNINQFIQNYDTFAPENMDFDFVERCYGCYFLFLELFF